VNARSLMVVCLALGQGRFERVRTFRNCKASNPTLCAHTTWCRKERSAVAERNGKSFQEFRQRPPTPQHPPPPPTRKRSWIGGSKASRIRGSESENRTYKRIDLN